MTKTVRRFVLLVVTPAAVAVSAAPAASAAQVSFTNWSVSGKVHLAKLNQDVTLPPGATFNGTLDTATEQLTGHVRVPRFTQRLKVLNTVPVDATLDLVEAAPTSATVSLGGTTTIDGQSSLTVFIRRLQSPLLALNLVSSQCHTSAPVVLPLHYSGPPNFASGFTFTGTTTIPPLTQCGLSTSLLNLLMAGPGNTFSVHIAPPTI
jgi:hypothetical protein